MYTTRTSCTLLYAQAKNTFKTGIFNPAKTSAHKASPGLSFPMPRILLTFSLYNFGLTTMMWPNMYEEVVDNF